MQTYIEPGGIQICIDFVNQLFWTVILALKANTDGGIGYSSFRMIVDEISSFNIPTCSTSSVVVVL